MSRQRDTSIRLTRQETVTKRAALEAQVEEAFITTIEEHGSEVCTTDNAAKVIAGYAEQARILFATLGGTDDHAVGAPREGTLKGVVSIMSFTLGTLDEGIDAAQAATAAFDLRVRSLAADY